MTGTRVLLAARAAGAGSALAFAGCGDPVSPLAPADLVGTYALQTVDGRPLPASSPNNTETVVYASERILRADGSYSTTQKFGPSTGLRRDTLTLSSTGTWELRRRSVRGHDAVWFADYDQGGPFVYSMKVRDRGRTLVLDENTAGQPTPVWVYVKR